MVVHSAGVTVIKPSTRLKWFQTVQGLIGAAILVYVAGTFSAPTAWKVAGVTFVAGFFLLGCLGLWREMMRLDLRGVIIRNRVRSYRFGWPEISCLADGASSRGNWELNVVLAGGRVVTARATNWATEAAAPEVLTAVSEAAGWHGTPTALTGIAIKHGLYADPGGQQGVRHWSGVWSPLLPVEVVTGKEKTSEYPGKVASDLPGADGTWVYAAARARKMTVRSAGLAALAALTFTAGIVINPKFYRPLRWLVHPPSDFRYVILCCGGFIGLLSAGLWYERIQMSKLDRTAKTASAPQ